MFLFGEFMLARIVCCSDTANGTSLCAFTASGALIVIDGCAVIIEPYCPCGTDLGTLATGDACI